MFADHAMSAMQTIGIDVGEVKVEVSGAISRDPRQLMAVGRQPRLDVDRAGERECLLASAGQIQPPQFHRLAIVTDKHHAAAIAGDIRLIIVSADGVGELSGIFTFQRLAPK